MKRIPQFVIEQLGYYVYLYVNPIDNKIFYVGKGKGNRVLTHLEDESESEKTKIIEQIRSQGLEPRIEFLVHGLTKESDALKIESAVIDIIGVSNLTNRVRGYESNQVGRMPLNQILALYSSEQAEIDDPVILLRINRLYRYDISSEELYEATRGVWKVGKRREKARYAFAVLYGLVREVYEIQKWFPAGTTEYSTREPVEIERPGRWEFIGQLAQETIRNKYLDKSISNYILPASRNPITYVNC
jgi:hypothetical protein